MGRGRRRRGLGVRAALALGLLASAVLGSVAGEAVGEVELGADGRQQQEQWRPSSGPKASDESTKPASSAAPSEQAAAEAATAEALMWELLDVARRSGDPQQQQQAQQEGAKQEVGGQVQVEAAIFRPLIPAIEAIRASLPGLYKQFHWAGVLQLILEYGMGCPMLTATRTLVTNVPPTIGHLHSMRKPVNPDGSLPRPLKDLVGFEGDFIDEATVQAERSTCTYGVCW